jgi:hypothetical protein
LAGDAFAARGFAALALAAGFFAAVVFAAGFFAALEAVALAEPAFNTDVVRDHSFHCIAAPNTARTSDITHVVVTVSTCQWPPDVHSGLAVAKLS